MQDMLMALVEEFEYGSCSVMVPECFPSVGCYEMASVHVVHDGYLSVGVVQGRADLVEQVYAQRSCRFVGG